MKKFILTLILCSTVSVFSNSFAVTKLIKIEEFHSPGTIGYMSPMSPDLSAKLWKEFDKKKIYQDPRISVFATAHNFTGKVMSYIPLYGNHGVKIYNDLNEIATFKVTYQLMCGSAYFGHSEYYSVDPHGIFSTDAVSNITFQPENAGDYAVIAMTTVNGGITVNSSDTGKVHVTQ
jgi:hypothetical protein